MSPGTPQSHGLLAVISGPSGVGKSTVIKRLLADERFVLSVSATTREPRAGEVDGRDYHFLDTAEFERRIAAGDFLEHAIVHGRHRYGTLREAVARQKADGHVVILDIDVQGGRALRDEPESVSVFIAPPSFEELERRLRSRATESDDLVQVRLETAHREMKERTQYDHVIVNDEIDDTVSRIREILLGHAVRRSS